MFSASPGKALVMNTKKADAAANGKVPSGMSSRVRDAPTPSHEIANIHHGFLSNRKAFTEQRPHHVMVFISPLMNSIT